MDCKEARGAFEDLAEGQKTLQDFPGLEEHLRQCQDCRDWYAAEGLVFVALDKLDRVPPPSDFAERALVRLPDAVPGVQSPPDSQPERARQSRPSLWSSMVSGLRRPRTHRVLVATLAVVASLLLAVGLWYVLGEGPVPASPGRATGLAAGAIVVGAILLGVVVVLVLVLGQRKD